MLPAIVTMASLYLTIVLMGGEFGISSPAVVIIAVLCLVLVQPPREINAYLNSARASAVIDVMLRWVLLLGALLIIDYGTKSQLRTYPQEVFVIWALVTPLALIATTFLMQGMVHYFLMNAFHRRTAIVAGYNVSSVELARRLEGSPEMHLDVNGFFDDRSIDRLGVESDAKLIGTLADMAGYVKQHRIDVIFIALPIRHLKRVMDLLDELRDTTASIYYVPDVFVFDLIQARSSEINGIPVVAMCETPFHGYHGVTKRLTDISLSLATLLLLLPLLALLAIAVKFSSPGPVIFKQRRYGLDGEEIAVYKFRTMRVTEDGPKVRQATKFDNRVTPIGSFLRRSSLDELPQLINVLQGRMSLVGPRPHAVAHNEEYRKLIKGYMLRHKVLPGITGLAQINGCRGETTKLEDMQARINFDLDYLRHWSPTLDIKIIMITVVKIFRDQKAY